MKPTKLLRWVLLASVGTIVACGGTSAIGSGEEEPGGKSGSTGMNTGASDPGMGASPGTGTGGAMAMGGKGSGMGGAEPIACDIDWDCDAQVVCETCADGGYVCPRAYCDAGKCVFSGDTCGVACQNDMECPVIDVPCTDCGDGTSACPASQCLKGQCQTIFPGCGNIDPCDGLPCGTECKSCGPDGMCAPADIASYCSAEGKCQPGLPQCATPGMCNSSMDCGTPPPNCVPCGNDTCAEFACITGKCVFACPVDPDPQCMTTEDCPPIDAVCKQCPGGMCAIQACIQNSCQMVCPL